MVTDQIYRVIRYHFPAVMGYGKNRDIATTKESPVARQEILIDDINGSRDNVQPVTLTLNGTTYTLDLGTESRDALMAALQPFINHARGGKKTRAKRATKENNGGTKAPSEIANLRHWARENGYEVGDRGRIPQHVQDAYAAR